MQKTLDLSLYLILDPPMCGGFEGTLTVAKAALEGGVSIVQLRAPTLKKKAWYELALALKPLCQNYQVPLIINDHIDVALAVDADGVHIGQDDFPVSVARKLLGPNKIIGLSVTNITELEQANKEQIDYVGIGPIFDTSTKTDAAKAIGFDSIQNYTQKSIHPNVLIGGLKEEHISTIKKLGGGGICVVSAICGAADPKVISERMKEKWREVNE